MTKIFILLTGIFLMSCNATTYYVVRHAEKESTNTMTTDVPLSSAGKQRADALAEALKGEKIRYIYSTNYQRTKSTAQPLAAMKGLTIETYQPNDTGFIQTIRNLPRGNVLIVGHSNTVDDILNRLAGNKIVPNDLDESEYGDLFVITRKKNKYTFERKRFGN